jgi:hypothetical protein
VPISARAAFNADGSILPIDPFVAPFKLSDVCKSLVNGMGRPDAPGQVTSVGEPCAPVLQSMEAAPVQKSLAVNW